MQTFQSQPAILVLEDDPNFRRLLKVALSREGHTVYTAADAQEALSLVRQEHSISLVTTDNKMPGMSGLEFLYEVEKLAPRILKVMISSTSEEELKPHLEQPGFLFAFHRKPARISEVIETIRMALSVVERKAQRAG